MPPAPASTTCLEAGGQTTPTPAGAEAKHQSEEGKGSAAANKDIAEEGVEAGAGSPEEGAGAAAANGQDENTDTMLGAAARKGQGGNAAAALPPKAVNQSKRLRVVDLKSLWTRAGKKSKTASTSTPVLQTMESRVLTEDSPSVHLETHNETEVEPGIGSTEPQDTGDAAPAEAVVIQEEEDEGSQDSEDSEAFYDVDWLPHDPGKRIPISDYNVNDQSDVRRRYIALGPCQPRGHDFPRKFVGGNHRFVPSW
ncbi:hypothetical protein ACP4OV_027821 [Aristida adscensionis]